MDYLSYKIKQNVDLAENYFFLPKEYFLKYYDLNHSFDANITIFPNKKVSEYRSEITGHPDSVNIRKMQMNTRSSDIIFILDQINKINSGLIKSSLNSKLDLKNITGMKII